jgi:hypothetical protein
VTVELQEEGNLFTNRQMIRIAAKYIDQNIIMMSLEDI